MVNITEQQKKVIEANGHMVIEFKLWCKKAVNSVWDICRAIAEFISSFIEEKMKIVIAWAEDVYEKFEKQSIENYADKFIRSMEPRERYKLCKTLGIDYKPYIRRTPLYHCRNNC